MARTTAADVLAEYVADDRCPWGAYEEGQLPNHVAGMLEVGCKFDDDDHCHMGRAGRYDAKACWLRYARAEAKRRNEGGDGDEQDGG